MRSAFAVLLLSCCAMAQDATVTVFNTSIYPIRYAARSSFRTMPVYVDGKEVLPSLPRHEFFVITLPAGEHEIAAYRLPGGHLTVEAGKSYYFEVVQSTNAWGTLSAPGLREVTEFNATTAMHSMKAVTP